MDMGADSDEQPTAEASSPGSPNSVHATSTAASTPATEPPRGREEEDEAPPTQPLPSAVSSPAEAEAPAAEEQQMFDDDDNGGDYVRTRPTTPAHLPRASAATSSASPPLLLQPSQRKLRSLMCRMECHCPRRRRWVMTTERTTQRPRTQRRATLPAGCSSLA